jgi:hypothetical protein
MKAMGKVKSTGSFGVDKGGKAMAGASGAAKAEAGKVSVGGRSAGNKFEADRGGKAMAGKTGAMRARAC